MTDKELKEWLKLSDEDKKSIFVEVSNNRGLSSAAVEKDWWVVRTLELIYKTEIASNTVFKGGTSLSKAWELIDRFSEDIDLALDRKFLGFDKKMTGAQVTKLRKESFNYISKKFFPLLQNKFDESGFENVILKIREAESTDVDPLVIEVNYPDSTDKIEYLPPVVLIEIGSRSLIEPCTDRQFCSFVGEVYEGKEFADSKIIIPAVNPERTFLEKIFLLHEEFQQNEEKQRVNRLSRHLFDLEKMMDTEFAKKAFSNKDLYENIVEHRKTLTKVRGIDYANHIPSKINIIPPEKFLDLWKKDYEKMQNSMIYTNSLPFEELIERMKELNKRINEINNA